MQEFASQTESRLNALEVAASRIRKEDGIARIKELVYAVSKVFSKVVKEDVADKAIEEVVGSVLDRMNDMTGEI